MRVGNHSLGQSSLKLAYSTQVAPHLRGSLRVLSHLFTTPEGRKQGDASKLMRMVCQQCDETAITLLIHVSPFSKGGMDKEQLIAWYENDFGFFALPQADDVFIRLPRGVQPVKKFAVTEVAHATEAAIGK